MATDDNALPHLIDLRLRVKNADDSECKDVVADLRIHRTEIDCPDGALISIKLRKATLELDLTGLEPLPKTRLGEPVRELQIVEKQSTTVKTIAAGKVAAHAGLSLNQLVPANLSLAADATVETKATVTHASKADVAEFRVKARGGDTWEISEPLKHGAQGAPVLDGTYLEDSTLCKVQPQRGANNMGVGLSAYARQRDIVLSLAKSSLRHNFVNTNQEKLFAILIARSMGIVGSKYAGIVKFSKSELDLED